MLRLPGEFVSELPLELFGLSEELVNDAEYVCHVLLLGCDGRFQVALQTESRLANDMALGR